MNKDLDHRLDSYRIEVNAISSNFVGSVICPKCGCKFILLVIPSVFYHLHHHLNLGFVSALYLSISSRVIECGFVVYDKEFC